MAGGLNPRLEAHVATVSAQKPKTIFSHCVLLQRLRRKPCGDYEKSPLKSASKSKWRERALRILTLTASLNDFLTKLDEKTAEPPEASAAIF